jgi:hypothetical protein
MSANVVALEWVDVLLVILSGLCVLILCKKFFRFLKSIGRGDPKQIASKIVDTLIREQQTEIKFM